MAQVFLTSFLAIAFTAINCWFLYASFIPHKTDLVAEFVRITSRQSAAGRSTGATENAAAAPAPAPANGGPSSDASCDLARGEWVPDSREPIYTNETCKYIHPNQNCMKNGRPDRGYLNWRWKPRSCELPEFDPARFLELNRGKRFAFIGDSLGRNHMQSLLCALVQAEQPEMIGHFEYSDLEEWWRFPKHNFTLRNVWSPFFVKYSSKGELFDLHLDVLEENWASHLEDFDIVVLGVGYWYYRPSVYFTGNKAIGCTPRSGLNCTSMEELAAFRIVHSNVLRFMADKFRGLLMLRTITLDHFEHGSWNGGGLCNRTSPYLGDDTSRAMPWMGSQMHKIQVEEFDNVVKDAVSSSGRVGGFELLDVSYSTFMRPDGHPSFYRIQKPNTQPQYDCLHWCLPGPIDSWNQMIFAKLISL